MIQFQRLASRSACFEIAHHIIYILSKCLQKLAQLRRLLKLLRSALWRYVQAKVPMKSKLITVPPGCGVWQMRSLGLQLRSQGHVR